VGIAQASLTTRPYMKGRKASASDRRSQGMRFMLADMAIRTEAARALVYRACATIAPVIRERSFDYLGAAA